MLRLDRDGHLRALEKVAAATGIAVTLDELKKMTPAQLREFIRKISEKRVTGREIKQTRVTITPRFARMSLRATYKVLPTQLAGITRSISSIDDILQSQRAIARYVRRGRSDKSVRHKKQAGKVIETAEERVLATFLPSKAITALESLERHLAETAMLIMPSELRAEIKALKTHIDTLQKRIENVTRILIEEEIPLNHPRVHLILTQANARLREWQNRLEKKMKQLERYV